MDASVYLSLASSLCLLCLFVWLLRGQRVRQAIPTPKLFRSFLDHEPDVEPRRPNVPSPPSSMPSERFQEDYFLGEVFTFTDDASFDTGGSGEVKTFTGMCVEYSTKDGFSFLTIRLGDGSHRRVYVHDSSRGLRWVETSS